MIINKIKSLCFCCSEIFFKKEKNSKIPASAGTIRTGFPSSGSVDENRNFSFEFAPFGDFKEPGRGSPEEFFVDLRHFPGDDDKTVREIRRKGF